MSLLKRRKPVRTIAGLLLFVACPSLALADASGFRAACEYGLQHLDQLVAECRASGRSFGRDFLPGGRGPAVREQHRVRFMAVPRSKHFGLGCALTFGDRLQVAGIYYAVRPDLFESANAAPVTFVNPDAGSVGWRDGQGADMHAMLVKNFVQRNGALPASEPKQACVEHDAFSGVAHSRFEITKVSDPSSFRVRHCYEKYNRDNECIERTMRGFFDAGPDIDLIFFRYPVGIGANGEFLMSQKLYQGICIEKTRRVIEGDRIVEDACPQ